jgi:hypothetical protein
MNEQLAARLVVTGIMVIGVLKVENRMLRRQNKQLRNVMMYLVDMLDQNEITIDEFDKIAIALLAQE